METLRACPACRGTELEPFTDCVDQSVTREVFAIQLCTGCGLKFTNPRPGVAEIGRYYETDEYISHTDAEAPGIINHIYRWVRAYTLGRKRALIQSYLPMQGSLLDIGCGTGDFAGTMQQAGWQVVAVEPDADAAAIARRKNKIEVHDEQWLRDTGQTFDSVSMWHVLEHVHGLEERFTQLGKLVRPGGLLVIAVPNPESVDAAHYGNRWAAWDVPRHLYHFPPQMLRTRVEKEGFKAVKTKIMPFDPFYISLLTERHIHGSDRLLTGFWKGLHFWWMSLFASDRGSSQIYIFKKLD